MKIIGMQKNIPVKGKYVGGQKKAIKSPIPNSILFTMTNLTLLLLEIDFYYKLSR